jgi:CII-binding regulator of phage lambda lysogenization HflD
VLITPVNPDDIQKVKKNSEIAMQRDPEQEQTAKAPKYTIGETEDMRRTREALMQTKPVDVQPPPAYPVTFKQALTQSNYEVKDDKMEIKNILLFNNAKNSAPVLIGAVVVPSAKYNAASANDIKNLFEKYQQELEKAGIDDPIGFLVDLVSQDNAERVSVDALLSNLPQLKNEMGYTPEKLLIFFNQATYFSQNSLALVSADVLNKLAKNGLTDAETVARIFSNLATKETDQEKEQFISSVVKLNADLQSLAAEVQKDSMENREDYLFDKDKWLLAMIKNNSLDGLTFDRQFSCLKKIVDRDLETRFGFTDVGPTNYAEQMKNFPAAVKEAQLDYLLEQRGVKSLVDLLKPEDKAKLNQHLGIDIDSEYINGGEIEKYFFVNGMLGQNKELLNTMLAEYYSLGFLTDKNLDKIVELFLNVILAIPKEVLDSFNVYDGDYAELFSKTLQNLGYTGIEEYVFDNTAGVVLAGVAERIENLPPEAQILHDEYIKYAERIKALKTQLANNPDNEELKVKISNLETENQNRMAKMEEMLQKASSLAEGVAIVEAIGNMVRVGQKAGSLSETEAKEILARVNQTALDQLLANSLEFKNFLLTADFTQTSLPLNATDDKKLEYLKKLIEDTYSLSKWLAAKNAEEEQENRLLEKRKELASLNIPQPIRNLLSWVYGIDFENIDGAVARTIAEKVSRNENPLG